MAQNRIDYYFKDIERCSMCGDSAHGHSVIGKRLNRSQGLFPRRKKGVTTTIVKCSGCGLIYANPLPVPLNIQDHYGIPPEEYWREIHFEQNDDYFSDTIRKFRSMYNNQHNDTLKALDIGAGFGATMAVLEKAGFDVYGFEPSEPFYERAVTKLGISKEKIRLGAMEDMDYPEGMFDFISYGAVLEHIYDPGESICKAMKWLKPGGLIQIEVPSSKWLVHKIFNLYYRLSLTDYCANLSPMHEPFHLYEFHINSFQNHARLNGYEIVHSEYYVCETFMPRFTDFILIPLMKATGTGMQLSVWLKKTENRN
jgi:SAM-dependent methyltransferase